MPKHRPFCHPRNEPVEGYRVSDHPLYHTHANIIDRCLNPTSTSYNNYGGRGIRICEHWFDFRNFVRDMGPRPTPAHTIERKENDGHYEPSNCVWATANTQAVNRRMFETNTSGATGIKKTRVGNWHVVFDFEGKRHDIGRYDTFDLAVTIRAAWLAGFFAARGGLHGDA